MIDNLRVRLVFFRLEVILLSWRSYSSWKASVDTFIPKLVVLRLQGRSAQGHPGVQSARAHRWSASSQVMCFHNVWAGASLSSLPWLWLLRPLETSQKTISQHLLTFFGAIKRKSLVR